MTIILTPETADLLRQKAEHDGTDMKTTADALLAEILRWEAQDQAETIEGIRRGLEASDAGRARPFAEFAADMRTKYNLPEHYSDVEIGLEP